MTNVYGNTDKIVDGQDGDAADVSTPIDAIDAQMATHTFAGGRLTLSSTLPVPTSDISAASTLYYLPFGASGGSGLISLYDSGTSTVRTIDFTGSTVSLGLGSTSPTTLYDVFGYLNSGALALELLAWSSSTAGSSARATALAWGAGMYVKTGDATRRYLGTIFMYDTNAAYDTAGGHDLFNAHNQVPRRVRRAEATASWNYGTATWRASNNDAGSNSIYCTAGLDGTLVNLRFMQMVGGSSKNAYIGIGKDGTLTPVTRAVMSIDGVSTITALRSDAMAAGYHYYTPCEQSASGTTTFYANSINHIFSGYVMC